MDFVINAISWNTKIAPGNIGDVKTHQICNTGCRQITLYISYKLCVHHYIVMCFSHNTINIDI